MNTARRLERPLFAIESWKRVQTRKNLLLWPRIVRMPPISANLTQSWRFVHLFRAPDIIFITKACGASLFYLSQISNKEIAEKASAIADLKDKLEASSGYAAAARSKISSLECACHSTLLLSHIFSHATGTLASCSQFNPRSHAIHCVSQHKCRN